MSFGEYKLVLRKITFKKCLNALWVYISYYISVVYKKPFKSQAPIALSIEPTTSCNLRCPECPSGLRQFTRPTGMLQKKLFEQIITEHQKTLLQLTFYFQGEPYLNPDFLEMVKTAAERNIFTATSTNAHYLDEENARKTVESKLDKLIISIDGITQESYSTYRAGGQLDKVLEGAKNIVEWKRKLNSKTPHIVFQFIAMKQNENQISEIHQLGKDIGVDEVQIKTAQIYDFENGSGLIPQNEKYSRYRKNKKGKWEIKNELQNRCFRMWSSCVITWDGMVVPCCFDKDAKYPMGDLKIQSFNEIWNNQKYNDFRKSILKSRKEIDICKNCSEGTNVWS